jgi:hypothetical protein
MSHPVPARQRRRVSLRLESLEDRNVPSVALPLDGAALNGDELFADPVFGTIDHDRIPAANAPGSPARLSGASLGGQASVPVIDNDTGPVISTAPLTATFASALASINQGNVGSIAPPPGPLGTQGPRPLVNAPSIVTTFAGMDFKHTQQGEPPDSNAAAGPNSIVETVNQQMTVYNKSTGAVIFTAAFDSFFGSLPNAGKTSVSPSSNAEFSDPVVTFDDTANVFIVGDQYVDPGKGDSVEDLAVSTTSNPQVGGDWTLFQFHTGEGTTSTPTARWADFPGKIGFNFDTIVFTFNMYSDTAQGEKFQHVQVNVLNKANILAGNGGLPTITGTSNINQFDDSAANKFFTLSAAAMHGSTTGDPMYFLTNDYSNYYSQIDLVKLPSPMTTQASGFVITGLTVNSFFSAYGTGGNRLTTDLDSGIQSVATRNVGGTLEMVGAQTIATSKTGGNEHARWYEINLLATPVLNQQGDILPVKPGGDTYYPAIDLNASGDLGMTFVESVGTKGSSGGEVPSMYVTAHQVGEAAGSTEPAEEVFAGLADNIGTRGGDIAALTIDPSDNSFWACNEYITNNSTSGANWATGIADFSIGTLAAPTLTSLGQSSAPEMSAALTITLTGTNFVSTTVGQWDGVDLTSNKLSSTQLQVTIAANLLIEEGTHLIAVSDAAGTSTSLTFTITDAGFSSLVAASNLRSQVGQGLTNVEVATFTDPGTDGTTADYTAAVSFTDSSGVVHTVTGTVTALGNKQFAVFASTSFLYAKFGIFNFSVQVSDIGGTTQTVGGTIDVLSPPGLFFTDGINQLWLFVNGAFTNTGGFATKFSGGIDVNGNPECFFFDGNNQLWRYDNGVFKNLGAFGTQVVAGAGAVAFADANKVLWVFHDATNQFTDTGAVATRLSGGFDLQGHNIFAFTDPNNQVFELTNSGQIVNTGAFGTRISAGSDAQGNLEIWFTDGNNQIWRFDNGVNSTIGAFALTIQASFGGNLYFLDGVNQIWSLTDAGVATNTGAFATRISSGPGTDALFFTDGVNQVWELQHGVFTNTGGFSVKLSAF